MKPLRVIRLESEGQVRFSEFVTPVEERRQAFLGSGCSGIGNLYATSSRGAANKLLAELNREGVFRAALEETNRLYGDMLQRLA